MGTTQIAVLVASVIILFLIIIYNKLVRKRNQTQNAFGGLDALLKKRYDLIPNLVSTVKTYMKHERELLEQITRLRSEAAKGGLASDRKVDLNNRLSGLLGDMMIAVENYPDLKADKNFVHLQASLNEIEEQISAARRAYNATVTEYNDAVETFPNNLVSGIFGFRRKPVLEIDERERRPVDVKRLFAE